MKKNEMLGHFRIEKEIAQGGAARIYLAENRETGKTIALKIIHDHLRKKISFRKRLKREVKFISEIKSEHLIKILSSGEIDDKLYIEMEYFHSVTLNEWVRKNKKVSLKKFYRIALQICHGIEALHKKGIAHRDLSYGNILIGKDGLVKLTDFGLIKILPQNTQFAMLTELTDAGFTFGTLPFMPPEQCDGRETNEASDIYSLGINLYYMLTGRLPFENMVTANLIAAICKEEPDSITMQNDRVTYDLQTLIFNMLSKKRYNRINEISEVIRILEAQLGIIPDGRSERFSGKGKIGLIIIVIFFISLYLGLKRLPDGVLSDEETEDISLLSPGSELLDDDVGTDTYKNREIILNKLRESDFSVSYVGLTEIDGFSGDEAESINYAFLHAMTMIKHKKIVFLMDENRDEEDVLYAEFRVKRVGDSALIYEELSSVLERESYKNRKAVNLGGKMDMETVFIGLFLDTAFSSLNPIRI